MHEVVVDFYQGHLLREASYFVTDSAPMATNVQKLKTDLQGYRANKPEEGTAAESSDLSRGFVEFL